MTFSKHNAWNFIKDFSAINIGMAVYSFGWAAFLLPYHITTGGMAGMAAILQYAIGFPMQVTILIVNAILLAIAWWQLGAKFTLKTGYAVLALSTFLQLGQSMMTNSAGELIQLLGPDQDSMACVLGAVFNGLGIGIVFLSGGSTGGWDIVAALINKYRNVSLGRVLLYLDFFVIGSCWPIFHDWRMVVFGYVTLAVYTYALDMFINSSRQDVQLIIMTRNHTAISDKIVQNTCHSVTVLGGEGYYSHQDVKVLITIVHKQEVIKVLRMIKEADETAFISQSRCEGVYGNGFNVIKG